eukprot:UN04491
MKIQKVDDKTSTANHGFTLSPEKPDKGQTMKTFYAKDEKQRDDWVRYLAAAVVEESEGQGNSKSGRRVQSPRQPQQQKRSKNCSIECRQKISGNGEHNYAYGRYESTC